MNSVGDEPVRQDTAVRIESEGLSIADFVSSIWKYRWSSLAILAAAGIFAIIVAFVSTPVYRAQVLLGPMQQEGAAAGGLGGIVRQLGDIAPLVGMGGLGTVGLKEEALALVTSRNFLVQFIHEENLMPVLYPELEKLKASGETDEIPTLDDAYRRFERSILAIQEEKDSGLVRLAIEWRDPAIAADWANTLVRRINEHMRARAIAEAQRSNEYLQKELEKTNILGIQDSIYRLIESNISHIALASARDGYAFRIIDAAVPSEFKHFIKPRRVLIISLGFVGGTLLAIFVVLVRVSWRQVF